MSKPYDATTRKLIEMGPADWAAYLGTPLADPGRVTAIDSNLSTVTAEADKVLWIDAPRPWIEHVELQAGRDTRLDDRSHLYSTLLGYQFRVPVRTTLVLLRPEADGPELTGRRETRYHDGDVYNWFRYIPRTGRAETFPRVKDYVTTFSPKARILPTVTSREELHHGLVPSTPDRGTAAHRQ